VTVVAVLLTFVASAALAAAPKEQPKGMAIKFHPSGARVAVKGIVSAVDAKKKTLTVAVEEQAAGVKAPAKPGKLLVVVKSGAKLMSGTKPITLAQLKPGMHVRIVGVKLLTGKEVVADKVALLAPPAPAKPVAKPLLKPGAKAPQKARK